MDVSLHTPSINPKVEYYHIFEKTTLQWWPKVTTNPSEGGKEGTVGLCTSSFITAPYTQLD